MKEVLAIIGGIAIIVGIVFIIAYFIDLDEKVDGHSDRIRDLLESNTLLNNRVAVLERKLEKDKNEDAG